jgi:hypothetical protein
MIFAAVSGVALFAFGVSPLAFKTSSVDRHAPAWASSTGKHLLKAKQPSARVSPQQQHQQQHAPLSLSPTAAAPAVPSPTSSLSSNRMVLATPQFSNASFSMPYTPPQPIATPQPMSISPKHAPTNVVMPMSVQPSAHSQASYAMPGPSAADVAAVAAQDVDVDEEGRAVSAPRRRRVPNSKTKSVVDSIMGSIRSVTETSSSASSSSSSSNESGLDDISSRIFEQALGSSALPISSSTSSAFSSVSRAPPASTSSSSVSSAAYPAYAAPAMLQRVLPSTPPQVEAVSASSLRGGLGYRTRSAAPVAEVLLQSFTSVFRVFSR